MNGQQHVRRPHRGRNLELVLKQGLHCGNGRLIRPNHPYVMFRHDRLLSAGKTTAPVGIPSSHGLEDKGAAQARLTAPYESVEGGSSESHMNTSAPNALASAGKVPFGS